MGLHGKVLAARGL